MGEDGWVPNRPKEREQQYRDAMGWAEYIIIGYPQLLSDTPG